MMSPSSLWCWAWGRRSLDSFVVFATLRWLWTTGHHPLSCLLPTQSSFLLYPIIAEETTGVSSTLGTPLVYRDRRQPTVFHLATTNMSPALRLRTWFQGTWLCLCNCWVICYIKSISLPRKRFQNGGWPVVLWNGLSPPHSHFKTKCFPSHSFQDILSGLQLLRESLGITWKLLMEALHVPCSSLSLTLTYYRPLTIEEEAHFLGMIFKYLIF